MYSFNYGNLHFTAANSDYWYTGVVSRGDVPEETADNLALAELGGNREGYIRDNQLEWLDLDLRAAQDDPNVDWIIVFTHEPAFPNGGHAGDAMYWRTGDGGTSGYDNPDAPLGDVVNMRNRFWRTLAGYGKVLAVLAGHEHNYSRTLIDESIDPDFAGPVWQITSGGCGAPYYAMDDTVPWSGSVRRFSRSKHFCLFTVEGRTVGLEVYDATGQLIDEVEDLAEEKSSP